MVGIVEQNGVNKAMSVGGTLPAVQMVNSHVGSIRRSAATVTIFGPKVSTGANVTTRRIECQVGRQMKRHGGRMSSVTSITGQARHQGWLILSLPHGSLTGQVVAGNKQHWWERHALNVIRHWPRSTLAAAPRERVASRRRITVTGE